MGVNFFRFASFLSAVVLIFSNPLAGGPETTNEESAATEQKHVITRSSDDQDSLLHNGPVKDFVVAVRYKAYEEVRTGGELHVELTQKGNPVTLLDKEPHLFVKYKNPKWLKYGNLKVHHSIESLLKGHYWGRIAPNPDATEDVTVAIIFPGKQGTLRVTFNPKEILAIKEVIDTKRD